MHCSTHLESGGALLLGAELQLGTELQLVATLQWGAVLQLVVRLQLGVLQMSQQGVGLQVRAELHQLGVGLQ